MAFSFFGLLSLLLGVLAVFGLVLLMQLARLWPGSMFKALMLLLTVASIATVGLSGRTLRIVDEALLIDGGQSLVGKALLAAAVGLSVGLCCAWVFRRWQRGAVPSQVYTPASLVVPFSAFYAFSTLLPIAFGPNHYFHVSLAYAVFVFVALLLWVQCTSDDPVNILKLCLGLLVVASLVAAVVRPDLALQPGYSGLIPGFNSRLWGITAHANGLGVIAATLLVVEVAEPSRSKVWRWILLWSAPVALVMSQSKTSLATAIGGLLVIALWRIFASLRDGSTLQDARKKTSLQAGMLVIAVLLILICGWAMFGDTGRLLAAVSRKLNSRAIGDLSTGTGRIWIWEASLRAGLQAPLFGQGGDFWSLGNRMRLGLTGATHAHNLYLQVFVTSGLLGLASLLFLLSRLAGHAMRGAKISNGGTVAIMAMFFFRSLTEVPISPTSVLAPEFFAFVTFVVYALSRSGSVVASVELRPALRPVRLGAA